MRPRPARVRLFVGAGVLVLLLAAAGVFLLTQRNARATDVAAADSTGALAPDSARAEKKKDKKKGEKEEEKPVPVETALATARDLPALFNATGSLEARRQVDLIAKTQGQIVALRVEEGDIVEEGDVLLEIEHREEQLLYEKAKVQAENAERDLARMDGLKERGLGSESDHEGKQKLAEMAILDRDLAQVRLDEKIVRAPFAGLVTARDVVRGQTVTPGQKLFSVADASPLEVKLFLPDQIVRALRPGQPVEIRSDLSPLPVEGRVLRIAPSVDPATSTVKVTLQVESPDQRLRVGSFVRARITTDVHEDVVSVPKKALVPEAGSTYLFVAEADTVRKLVVEIGYADDAFVEITNGIGADARVVTVGQGGLRPGTKIRDLTRESASRDSTAAATNAPAVAQSAVNP